ncbi:serpentine type 7TM GPCR chemoreceptor srh domain-containing protein [Ditylenchus destructor]|nr:serpentine type 7TM GPCR chemoreceptor srh domain-containing protein [Ditylenchus destructor]
MSVPYQYNYNPSTSMADSHLMEDYFCPETEQTYLKLLTIGTIFAIPAHLLIIFIAAFRTPKEMINYKLTVTNTSLWSLAIVIHCGILLRPVPLFPLPAAKTTGILKYLGDTWGGQYQFIVFIEIVVNFLIAAIICFTVICLFLLQNNFRTLISRRTGILMAISVHFLVTTLTWIFLTFVYPPSTDLKSKLVAEYGLDLISVLKNDKVIFGYSTFGQEHYSEAGVTYRSLADPGCTFCVYFTGAQYFALGIFVLFLMTVIVVLILFALLIKVVWQGINKSSKKATNRYRRSVAIMLASRVCVPLIFGFLPVMIITFSLHFGIWHTYSVYCILTVTAISHGMFNSLATIAVFRPYRRGIIKMLYLHLPGSISNKIGLTDYVMETASWQTFRSRGVSNKSLKFPSSVTSSSHNVADNSKVMPVSPMHG